MKAFNFPLESLRTLRKQRERAAQQNYSRALAACDDAIRILGLAEEALKSAHSVLMNELAAGVPAGRAVHLRTWCNLLETRRNECVAALAEARCKASEALRLMTVAVREREALDRFHGKSKHLWQRAVQAEEQKMLDELAIQRQSPAIFAQPIFN